MADYLFAQMSSDQNDIKVECTSEPENKKEVTGFRKCLSSNLLFILTLLGVAGGIFMGLILRPLQISNNTILLLSYPGELFMRILKLIILPLIISSLIAASANLNARLNGTIAIRTLIYFLVTSVINAVLGVILAISLRPGDPDLKLELSEIARYPQPKSTSSVLDSLLDLGRNCSTISEIELDYIQTFFHQLKNRLDLETPLFNYRNIFADNIFQATFQQAYTGYGNQTVQVFNKETGVLDSDKIITIRSTHYRSGTNTIGIVVFCLTFGTILGTLGKKGQPVIDFFWVIFEVVMKMVTGVIWLTPVGVSSVIAGKILSVSNISVVIYQLGWFIVTVVIGVFIYQLIIMQLIYLILVRKNPFKFYWGLMQGTLTSFATASTAAALPVTFTLMDEKVKIDLRISRFVLPIGCNINMDGTALFLSVASIFIAQMNRIPIGLGEMITVCFTSTAASFSSASVPSAALVLLLMVLSAIDTPTEDVSLLFAIDWLVDRFRTTNNMLGDCYAAAVVEKLSKKELMACDAIQEVPAFIPYKNEKYEDDIQGPCEIIIDGLSNGTTQ